MYYYCYYYYFNKGNNCTHNDYKQVNAYVYANSSGMPLDSIAVALALTMCLP